jgi:plasmid stabilization system protein ParE
LIKLYWTKEALTRLQEIEKFIARDNPKVAIEFTDKLISISETIPNNPEKGRIVPELAIEQIREVLYKGYRIVYYRKETSIEILTVFEGHQLLKKEEILKNISK